MLAILNDLKRIGSDQRLAGTIWRRDEKGSLGPSTQHGLENMDRL
jgi:hypothetical protein